MQNHPYQLQWLDSVVIGILNPQNANYKLLENTNLEELGIQLKIETEKQMLFLKKQALLRIANHKLVYHYRMMIIRLLDQCYFNMELTDPLGPDLISVNQQMIRSLKQILELLDQLFSNSVFMSQPLPVIELRKHHDFISGQLAALKENLLSKIGSDQLKRIVLYFFERSDPHMVVTGRDIHYKMKLLKALLEIPLSFDDEQNHHKLIATMVYHNFNSRTFLDYYASLVSQTIQNQEDRSQKLTALLSWQKKFKQLHHSRHLIYNPAFDSVKKVIGSWFKEEFRFLENSDVSIVQQADSPLPIKKSQSEVSKILCLLSVDQISVLLRALDSLRIIQVKSFNSLIQNITPYLATPRKEDISWQSLRSKSYTIEENGRAELIKILESVIVWIREY